MPLVTALTSDPIDLHLFDTPIQAADDRSGVDNVFDAADAARQEINAPDLANNSRGLVGLRLTELRSQIESAIRTAHTSSGDSGTDLVSRLDNARIDLATLRHENAGQLNVFTGQADAADAAPLLVAGSPPADPRIAAYDASSTTLAPGNDAAAAAAPPAIASLLAGSGINPATFQSTISTILHNPSSHSIDEVSPLFEAARVGSSVDLTA